MVNDNRKQGLGKSGYKTLVRGFSEFTVTVGIRHDAGPGSATFKLTPTGRPFRLSPGSDCVPINGGLCPVGNNAPAIQVPDTAVTQDWGGAAQGGLNALFASDPLADRTGGGEATARWAAEAAWGFPAFSGRFTGSPHVGLGLATDARDYSLGWRLTPAANANAPDIAFGVKGTRRESGWAEPEHTLGLETTLRW